MQISHVLFMQNSRGMRGMLTVDRNAKKLVRDHHYWMGKLMMLVSKKKY